MPSIGEPMLSGSYFNVALAGVGIVLAGGFTTVSGLGMDADYDVYSEGGSSYPRYFYKGARPRQLVLEQGVITTVDSMSMLMTMVNQGMSVPLGGLITLQDSFGTPMRSWTIVGAHLLRFEGPQFNANQVSMAVNRVEFLYNGCV